MRHKYGYIDPKFLDFKITDQEWVNLKTKILDACSDQEKEVRAQLSTVLRIAEETLKENKKASYAILYQFLDENIILYTNSPKLKSFYEIWDIMKETFKDSVPPVKK